MKKRTSRIVAITLVLVLCMSMMPVMALAMANDSTTGPVEGHITGNLDSDDPTTGTAEGHITGTDNPNEPTGTPREEDPSAREPFRYERVPKPEEPAKEPEEQPERQPDEPQEDPGRIVTERFIRLIETGRGFEELWSNRESPVWTLGDIENYLSRRAGRIPTAGVGFIAHP